MNLSIEQGAALVGRLRSAVAERVIGQDAAIEDALVAFLARGHLLIEGVPGQEAASLDTPQNLVLKLEDDRLTWL